MTQWRAQACSKSITRCEFDRDAYMERMLRLSSSSSCVFCNMSLSAFEHLQRPATTQGGGSGRSPLSFSQARQEFPNNQHKASCSSRAQGQAIPFCKEPQCSTDAHLQGKWSKNMEGDTTMSLSMSRVPMTALCVCLVPWLGTQQLLHPLKSSASPWVRSICMICPGT